VTINRGTKYAFRTVVGSNCLLMAYSHVAHDCFIGNNVILANSVNLAGHIEVGDWAILEGLVAVQQFIKIGAHAFIAGGSLVRKDVPPFVKAGREPLSYVGVNSVGLRRRGFSAESIQHIQDIYRLLFVRGYNVTKALNIIEAEVPASAERDMIVTFIRNSKEGVMKGFRHINE
ncbi:MAG: acyl-[acyl-carrier-protein]--UDP-N-acetylglucosamine O-acyltransferase, partial [Chitinophagales bacterium]